MRLVSEDGTTALVQVRFDASMQEISPDDLALVPETGEQLAEAGVEVDYGQELVFSTEVGGIGEAIGVGVATVVLLVMLGSLVMAGMPLAVAFTGVGVSLLGALALTHWLDLQQMAPVLGAMLGLAVGIDYALFIVNRHRRQLADLAHDGHEIDREDVRHSIGLATGTAGTAVVVAGATVVIALAALLVSGIPVLVQMGVLAAATVLVTVLVALTLTPALLSLAGRRAIPRRTTQDRPRKDGWPEKWVDAVTRRARPPWSPSCCSWACWRSPHSRCGSACRTAARRRPTRRLPGLRARGRGLRSRRQRPDRGLGRRRAAGRPGRPRGHPGPHRVRARGGGGCQRRAPHRGQRGPPDARVPGRLHRRPVGREHGRDRRRAPRDR